MITCYLQYKIDPYKLAEFREYAEMWIPLVEKFGGQHHGYFLPKESANDLAVALFSFESLAAYEQYRADARQDEACRRAVRFADETRCIQSYTRQFLEPVFADKLSPAEG